MGLFGLIKGVAERATVSVKGWMETDYVKGAAAVGFGLATGEIITNAVAVHVRATGWKDLAVRGLVKALWSAIEYFAFRPLSPTFAALASIGTFASFLAVDLVRYLLKKDVATIGKELGAMFAAWGPKVVVKSFTMETAAEAAPTREATEVVPVSA